MSVGNILNFLKPKVLADFPSQFNDRIIVKERSGHRYLTTNNQTVTQSGDIVREVWEPAIKKIAQPEKSWLILGLAGGTLVNMVSKNYSPYEIVGVEIDPVMIEVGIKYFNLESVPSLKIVKADAKKYLTRTKKEFDYVLVDLFFGENPADFIYSDAFISDTKRVGKTVVVNHMFYNNDTQKKASLLVENLKKHFTQVELVRSLANLLVIMKA